MKQLTFENLLRNQDLEYNEMLKFLVNKGFLFKKGDDYFWSDIKCILGERPEVVLPKCPDCGARHVNTTPDCNNVYGRRGFRQLGEYDS